VLDKGRESERTSEKYVFSTTVGIAGTEDLKIKVKVEIDKDRLDNT
jgi:hypothetical protein